MIIIKKYAAIDIGSNAMRLLITNIVEQDGVQTQFNKSSLVRVPIRLGQDAFTVGQISHENIQRMSDAMKAFFLLMKVHKVEKYSAFATSAMREAKNGKEVVGIINKEANIKIENLKMLQSSCTNSVDFQPIEMCNRSFNSSSGRYCASAGLKKCL